MMTDDSDLGHLQLKYNNNHPNKNRLSEVSNDSIQDTLIGLPPKRTTMCFSLLKIVNFSTAFMLLIKIVISDPLEKFSTLTMRDEVFTPQFSERGEST